MKITIIGRGNVGGTLERLLSANGHDVEALGSEGGDASGADAVVLAVPGGAVEDALRSVTGVEGKSSSTRRTRCEVGRTESSRCRPGRSRSRTGRPRRRSTRTSRTSSSRRQTPANGRRCPSAGTTRPCASPSSSRASAATSHWSWLEHAAGLEDYVGGVLVPLAMTRGPFFYRFDWPGGR